MFRDTEYGKVGKEGKVGKHLYTVTEAFHAAIPTLLVSLHRAIHLISFVYHNFITQTHRPSPMPSLVKELVSSSWTMWDVLVLRADLWTVPIMELAHITVPTLKMLVSAAVLVCITKHDGGIAIIV